MSLQFHDSSTYKGIVQIYEKEIGANRGDISGDTNKLKELAADVNLAWDEYLHIAIPAGGKHQYDDSNHTDYPIITTNLVLNQRDYALTTDGSSNLILDIYKVAILPSATATTYTEILPVDAQSDQDSPFVANNTSVTGVPDTYDKTANAIFLNPIPSYNATNGLKVYINREPSYFTSSDTTKKPGCPGIHHRYFAIRPAMDYARRNNLAVFPGLQLEVAKMERDIEEYFSRRSKDEVVRMTPEITNYE